MSSTQNPPTAAPRRARPARAPRCERLSECLLEAMRAGVKPAVEQRGPGWVVISKGKVYARRKERARADALLEAALRELGRGAEPAPPAEERRRNVLLTPQRPDGEIVRYEIVSAADLQPSHRHTDFQPAPQYPSGVQERAYHLDKGERQKVIRGAQRLRVELVLSRSPTATDGPPIVTERLLGGHGRYLVMGGNGRGMMLRRAYDGNGAEEYRQALIRQAPEFGLTAEQAKAIDKPILVRVLEGLPADAPRELLMAAVRRTNESLTQGIDAATLGVAHARALSAASVQQIGEALGDGDYSLRELMAARPDLFRDALQRDQVITPQNASEWLTAAGALTESGKDRLEAMFMGLVLGSKDRIQATAPALMRKLERAVPHLLAVRAAQIPAFDLVPLAQEAVDLLNDARAHDLSLDDSLRQPDLLDGGPTRSERSVALARMLATAGQRAVAEAFARWAKTAIHDPRQALLFGSPPTPEEAFQALLGSGRLRNPGQKAPVLVKCERCQGAGRIVPWAGKIDVCPTCHGERAVEAPAPGDARQQRLINPPKQRTGPCRRDQVPTASRPAPRGKKVRKVPVLTTSATNTRQLARALRKRFGVALPRRVNIRAPAGALRLRKINGTWAVWCDGKPNADLARSLAADLRQAD